MDSANGFALAVGVAIGLVLAAIVVVHFAAASGRVRGRVRPMSSPALVALLARRHDAGVTDGWNRCADEARDVVLRVLGDTEPVLADRVLAALPAQRDAEPSVPGAEVRA